MGICCNWCVDSGHRSHASLSCFEDDRGQDHIMEERNQAAHQSEIMEMGQCNRVGQLDIGIRIRYTGVLLGDCVQNLNLRAIWEITSSCDFLTCCSSVVIVVVISCQSKSLTRIWCGICSVLLPAIVHRLQWMYYQAPCRNVKCST